MTTIEAGTQVKKGYYFSAKSWTLQPVAADGTTLPGERGEKFIHVPLLLAFAVAPMMGAAFLMFLPFLGFYLTAVAVSRPIVGLFTRSASELAATVQPGWAPGEAHLAGKRPEAEGEKAADARLDTLEKEIAARRDEEKKS